jgi:hypothetical protein
VTSDVGQYVVINGGMAALGIFVFSIARTIRNLGGRRFARVLPWAMYAIAWIGFDAVRAAGVPILVPFGAVGILVALVLCPTCFIEVTGGPYPVVGLALAVADIYDDCRLIVGGMPDEEADQLRLRLSKKLARLDRVRTPETDEYIRLFREWIPDLISGGPMDHDLGRIQRDRELAREFHAEIVKRGIEGRISRWGSTLEDIPPGAGSAHPPP